MNLFCIFKTSSNQTEIRFFILFDQRWFWQLIPIKFYLTWYQIRIPTSDHTKSMASLLFTYKVCRNSQLLIYVRPRSLVENIVKWRTNVNYFFKTLKIFQIFIHPSSMYIWKCKCAKPTVSQKSQNNFPKSLRCLTNNFS